MVTMPNQPNPSRLEWNGSTGFLCHDGIQATLHHAPGRLYHQIHFTPGMQAEVQEHPSDPKREMTGEEIAMFGRWLAAASRRMYESIGQLET